jgi:pimeloyl-ACP methyl ester carboxylesterase
MATFVVAHGAWTGGWFWRKLVPLLQQRGHVVFTPTYTGLGERVHLAHRGITLDDHIQDVLQLLHFEDLHEVVLVGHSYGGMVATGVADKVPQRLSQLIYLDAFVPRDGDSAQSLWGDEARRKQMDAVAQSGDGWQVPANPMPPDTAAEDQAWAVPRRVLQPLETFRQPIRLTGAVERVPRSYIYCTRSGPGDVFRPFARRAQGEPGWRYREIDASHSPQVTAPQALADLLCALLAP